MEMLLDENDSKPENVILLQEKAGFQDMMDSMMEMAEQKLKRLNERKRETLPLSDLCIGMQCGGSDSFSGVTANPSAGYAADLLVQAGATVLFSEVTEVRDGVHLLAERCVDNQVGKKLIAEMKWYDNYLAGGEWTALRTRAPAIKKAGCPISWRKRWDRSQNRESPRLWRSCPRLRGRQSTA